jgi:hypothetical protein
VGHNIRTTRCRQQCKAQFSASEDARQYCDDQQPGTNNKTLTEESEVQCQPTKTVVRSPSRNVPLSCWDAQEQFHQKMLKIKFLVVGGSGNSSSNNSAFPERLLEPV